MNNFKNESSQNEMGSDNPKSQTKHKNVYVMLLTLFGAIAGFTSGHLHNIYGIVLFSISIIAIGIVLFYYYRKK